MAKPGQLKRTAEYKEWLNKDYSPPNTGSEQSRPWRKRKQRSTLSNDTPKPCKTNNESTGCNSTLKGSSRPWK